MIIYNAVIGWFKNKYVLTCIPCSLSKTSKAIPDLNK